MRTTCGFDGIEEKHVLILKEERMKTFKCLTLILAASLDLAFSEDCKVGDFGEDSFVCVCDINDCGFIGEIPPTAYGSYTKMSSSKDGDRFNISVNSVNINESLELDAKVSINITKKLQEIIGFGGSFTDSTGINMNSLSGSLEETLLKSYFSPDGLEYNVARIPIAGSDFSTHPYSYDDHDGDVKLEQWALTYEDYNFKIPYVKQALEMSKRSVKLFGSPWAPPSWMKTNGEVDGKGGLLPEMRQPWANYFIKFLEAYSNEGLDMWGLTVQNEPTMGYVNSHQWNACGYSASEERDFVKYFLGPTLKSSAYSNIKLMINDDSRQYLPYRPTTILSDDVVNNFTSGVAVHWYADNIIPSSVLDTVHNRFPDKFIMYTEASAALLTGDIKLGSWTRAQEYAQNIIEDLNHWVGGWTDWNMALDMNGGPNWSVLLLDSPIIVNANRNEFYKQPMFYAMGHFSKLIPAGSRVLKTTVAPLLEKRLKVDATSVITPDDQIVVVLLNRENTPQDILIESDEGGFTLTLEPKSFHTIAFAKKNAESNSGKSNYNLQEVMTVFISLIFTKCFTRG